MAHNPINFTIAARAIITFTATITFAGDFQQVTLPILILGVMIFGLH